MEEELNLNPDTVSLLTKTIEASLKRPKFSKNGKPLNNKHNGSNTKCKPVVDRKTNREASVSKLRPGTGTASQQINSRSAGKLSTNPKAQNRKRSSDGQLKQQSGQTFDTQGVTKTREDHTDLLQERSALQQAILALGGSKNDLDLIQGEASESEVDGDASVSKSTGSKELKNELLRYVQELGIMEVPREIQEVSESQEHEISSNPRNTKSKASETILTNLSLLQKPRNGRTKPEVEPSAEWYSITLPALSAPNTNFVALPLDLTNRIHEYAKSLLNTENERYASQDPSANSTQQFYSTIMSSGTLSDKISALTLSIQESPLHNMKTLDALVGLARKRSRGQAVEVLGALKDMFGLGYLLPPDRKLRHFATQPDLVSSFSSELTWTAGDPLPQSLTEPYLIHWAFEDWLKGMYFEVLKILETWSNDEVVFARGKAIDYICQLLKEKPEQEANLLRLLVNKLGDKDKKVASKTSYHILQLQTAHPLMKPVVVSAIESGLLFRPNQSLHAQYYAVITLNQTVLSSKEEDLPKKLLDIYFSLFAKLLAKPDSKATSEVAHPIKVNQKGEIQGGGGPAGKAARRKAARNEKATIVEEDLREKMLSAVLTGVNRAVPYFNTANETFEKQLDTLFQITHSSNFNTSIQALMLIQQIHTTDQASSDRYYRTLYESLLDPRLLTSSKQALYLNLLFKSLRSDLNVKRVKAFAKRLLQVASMHQPSFACGAIYMLRELEAVFASFSTFVDDPEADNSDEEEIFNDVQETELGEPVKDIHPDRRISRKPSIQSYDPRKRDPEHSKADRSSLWELLPATIHYHPSVSLFATTLLNHRPLPPKPDLASHTLIHFLDRFVYRNPKSTVSARGASIMQPMSSFTNDKTLLSSAFSLRARNNQPVNSDAFWQLDQDQVGADEVFFHKYFRAIGKGRDKAKAKKNKKNKKKQNEREDEEGSGEEDEEEIWKALVDSRPEIEGEEHDGDLAMEDLEDLDDEMPSASEDEGEQSTDGGEGVQLDDDGIPDFAEADDSQSLLGSEDDVPTNLQAAFEKEAELVERRGKDRNKERKEKRLKLKHLPTFASMEDYEEMLGADEEGL
ncbi:MAG: hypothetical protein Q9198_000900 [Flavoplaca austrocitrina]